MTVKQSDNDKQRFSIDVIARLLKKYGPGLASLPLVLTFLYYVYDRGSAAAFGIPSALVKPDPTRLYEAVLFSIPFMLLFLVVGLGTTPPNVRAEPIEIKKPRKHTIWSALGIRLMFAILLALSAYFFLHPYGSDPDYWRNFLVISTIVYSLACLPLAIGAIVHAFKNRTWYVVNESDPIYRNLTWIFICCAIIYSTLATYSTGYSSAKDALLHYVLAGSNPEVVLLTSYDGYVTADFDPRTPSVRAEYRWHEWKEHRQMILLRTGKLPTPTVIGNRDKHILETDLEATKPEK